MRGPIDYIVVEFDNLKFDGTVLETLEKPIAHGIINLLDIAVVSRDAKGNIKRITAVDTGDEMIIHFSEKHSLGGLIDSDDITEIGECLEDGSTAALLIIEQLWAKPLKEALINKDAKVLLQGRIHPDAAAELN